MMSNSNTDNRKDKPLILYIVGSGHSGSTLLDVLLSSHERVFGLGEVEKIGAKFFLERGTCACGERFRNCTFWKPLWNKLQRYSKKRIRHIRRSRTDFLLNRPRYYFRTQSNELATVDEYRLSNKMVIEYVKKTTGAEVLIDSTKSLDRLEFLQNTNEYEVKALHLVREGLGVVWSNYKKTGKYWPFMKQWAFENIKVEIAKKRSEYKYLTVFYSDLVERPDETLEQIKCFIDKPTLSKQDISALEPHHINGNAGTFQRISAGIKPDYKWRQMIPLKCKLVFYCVFGWLQLYYDLWSMIRRRFGA